MVQCHNVTLVLEVSVAPNWAPIACIAGVNREGIGKQKCEEEVPLLPSMLCLPLPCLTPAVHARAPATSFPERGGAPVLCYVVSKTNMICSDLSCVFIPGLQETSGLWSRLKEI